MNLYEFQDSKKNIPQNFVFEEEFDPNCFEEDIGETLPQKLVTKQSKLILTKKEGLRNDFIELLTKYKLKHDLSHENHFDTLIDKIIVWSEDDPEYAKHMRIN